VVERRTVKNDPDILSIIGAERQALMVSDIPWAQGPLGRGRAIGRRPPGKIHRQSHARRNEGERFGFGFMSAIANDIVMYEGAAERNHRSRFSMPR